jgi:thiol-disulfide isomerase/thioredoxin
MMTELTSRKIALLFFMLVVLSLSTAVRPGSPPFQNLGSGEFETLDTYAGNGKWLIVMIWAHDCEICEREVGDYEKFHQKHVDDNARVLGITLDGEANRQLALDFVSRHRLNFENLIAEPETVAAFFEVTTGSKWVGTPTFLIFGPGGELKAKQVGAVETEIVESFIAAN